jgi:hypothetical protein
MQQGIPTSQYQLEGMMGYFSIAIGLFQQFACAFP